MRSVLYFLLICASLVMILTVIGQPLWCSCGEFRLLEISAWSSHTSQHVLDPYTFSHIQHGMFFFYIFYLIKMPFQYRLWSAMLIESGWEILENSPIIIDRYRSATAALDYFGDSVINSTADLLSCVFGFYLAFRLPWKVTLGLFLAFEIGMIIVYRDSLGLNVLMLLYPIEAIKEWQLKGQF